MLKIVKYSKRSDLKSILDSFDDGLSTWVVSDLKSKYEIQKLLLDKKNFFFETSCFRISDLWKTLLKILYPEVRVWPQSLYKLSLKKFLKENREHLQVDENSVDTIFNYQQQISPLLFHPDRNGIVMDFFAKNEKALDRWQVWYVSALAAHLHLFENKKIVLQSQIPSLLQNNLSLKKAWDKDLILDLGTEVSQIEMDLIKLLSQSINVTVLEPSFDLQNNYQFLKRPYERIQQYASERNALGDVKSKIQPEVVCQKLTSQLAEVKYVCEHIRSLAAKDIPFTKIGIIANKIESYWPVLQIHLSEEGIPYNKDLVVRAQSMLPVQNWLNKLKIFDRDVTSENLENELFNDRSEPSISFENFKKIYGIIYDFDDLSRVESIYQLFNSKVQKNQVMNLEHFIVHSLKYCPTDEINEIITPIYKKMMELTQFGESFFWGEWVSFLSDLVSQKEILIESGDEGGVQVCSLSSSHSYGCEYLFVLGLTDEQLREKQKTLISNEDAWILIKDYDIEIQATEESQAEFEIAWGLERAEAKMHLLAPHSDFEGSLLTLSPLYLKYENQNAEKAKFIPRSKLDYMMQSFDGKYENKNLQETKWWIKQPILPLSATAIEDYKKCPFIYAAERVYQLKDFDAIDIEIQPMSQGSAIHALFETILRKHPDLKATEGDLITAVDEVLKSVTDFKYYEKFLLEISRDKFLKLAKKFILSEQDLRNNFPGLKPYAFELKFLFFYDLDTDTFHSSMPENANEKNIFRIAGSIDRVDIFDNNKLVLIDYKGSKGQLSSFQSWLKNDSFQLLFYTWIGEQLLFKEKSFEVVSAVYLIYKDFSRDIGFNLAEHNGINVPAVKKTGIVSAEQKQSVVDEFKIIFKSAAESIKQSKFKPEPKNTEDCKLCHWRRMCRAPHLN